MGEGRCPSFEDVTPPFGAINMLKMVTQFTRNIDKFYKKSPSGFRKFVQTTSDQEFPSLFHHL